MAGQGKTKTVLAAMLAVAAAATLARAEPEGAPAALRLMPVEVMDIEGFDRPLAAYTAMVPTGWRTVGGIRWERQNPCNSGGYSIAWQASAADDSAVVAILPAVAWNTSEAGGCPAIEANTAEEFLSLYARHLLPGAEVLSYRERPDLLEEVAETATPPEQAPALWEVRADAGEILVAFTAEGRPMKATLAAQVTLWRITVSGGFGEPGQVAAGGWSTAVFGAAGAAESFDPALGETIRRTIRPGDDWAREIVRYYSSLQRLRNQYNAVPVDIGSNLADEGSLDDVPGLLPAATDGVRLHDDPLGGAAVQVSDAYDHVWRLDDGTVVLTGDAGFDPAAAYGIAGRLLLPQP